MCLRLPRRSGRGGRTAASPGRPGDGGGTGVGEATDTFDTVRPVWSV
ncbi:hypothetical protein BN903_267 [Halorubrum sp. AJ67]|nr:hypothetical protein BN903_267 [Halorubrum sp. AJ67]